ncbi:MAG: electron transport complex subunit RsxC [Pseudohongiellaceae bacterium]
MLSQAVRWLTERRLASFSGGIRPPRQTQRTLRSRVMATPIPQRLFLSLTTYSKQERLTPVVRLGEAVRKYQCLATHLQDSDLILHAPTSGMITAISRDTLEIQSDGLDQALTLRGSTTEKITQAAILESIGRAGIVGQGGAGYPTIKKIRLAASAGAKVLIVNAAECEPFVCCDEALIREFADQVVKGAEYLMQASAADAGIIAIESDKLEAIEAIQEPLKASSLTLRLLAAKYPAGDERILIKSLTGQEIPDSVHPAERGILVQNAGTAKAVFDAVKLGQPSISRIVTVAGAPLKTPKNFSALLGTPVSDLLSWCGFEHESHSEKSSAHFQHTDHSKIIIGGPLTGRRAEMFRESVQQTTTCVIATDKINFPASGPEHACIRCGFCADACPVGLLPQQLLLYSRNFDEHNLNSHGLHSCIECGACAYVCPSKIPLVQHYRQSKAILRDSAAERSESQLRQARYRHWQTRQGKAARRQVKQAAEPERETPFSRENAKSEIAEAVARVKEKKSGNRQ